MGIAFVSPGWPPGGQNSNGIVSYVGNMLEGLHDCGVVAKVLTGFGESAGWPEYVHRIPDWRDRYCRLWKMAIKASWRLRPLYWSRRLAADSLLAAVDQIHRKGGLDLIEMEESFGVARFVAPRSPVPIVVRLHGPWMVVGAELGQPTDSDFRQRVRAEGRALVSAAGISAPSEDVLRRVRSYYGVELPDAKVIPNPIAPAPPEGCWSLGQCDRNVFLFVGRFDRVKGGDVAIEAFNRVAGVHRQARLVFVGPDCGYADQQGHRWSLAEFLRERVPDTGVRRRIEYRGTCSSSEILSLRRRCLAAVVCSRYEVFGYTAAEAMACRCPLIAADTGGLSEMVQHERNGLLCRPGDSEDLAAKMITLLRNTELAARLGRQAAIDAEQRYHPKVIAERMMTFYGRVIERFTAHRAECRRWWGRNR